VHKGVLELINSYAKVVVLEFLKPPVPRQMAGELRSLLFLIVGCYLDLKKLHHPFPSGRGFSGSPAPLVRYMGMGSA
jgi:hypothetical protein